MVSSHLRTVSILAILVMKSDPSTSNNPGYLGCYTMDLVGTQPGYYRIKQPLSWENGVKACLRRYTTHMGVQSDNGKDDMNSFFCGNDLTDHTVKLKGSACAVCVNPPDRFCGGPKAMSLYRIRDLTPWVTYLGTTKGINVIEFFSESQKNYSSVIAGPDFLRIDLSFAYENILYTDANGNIYESFFDHQHTKYSAPSKLTVPSKSRCVAVDWVHKVLYFTGMGFVQEYDPSRNSIVKLFPSTKPCYDLTLDPYERTLFIVSENSSLSSFALLTKEFYTFEGGEKKNLQHAKRVAVDYDKKLIYAVVRVTADSRDSLVSVGYDDMNLELLFQGPELTDCSGLDVFKDHVVWANYANFRETIKIYMCQLSPTCKRENLKTLYAPPNGVHDVKIYHPLKQTPPYTYLCNTLNCSHSCTKVSLFMARCSCPQGLILGPDNITCEGEGILPTTEATPQPSSKSLPIFQNIILSIICLLVVVIAVLVPAVIVYIFTNKSKNTSTERDNEISSSGLGSKTSVDEAFRETEGNPGPPPIPRDPWEIPKHRIKVFNMLGEGCFGQVWKGEATKIAVPRALFSDHTSKKGKTCRRSTHTHDGDISTQDGVILQDTQMNPVPPTNLIDSKDNTKSKTVPERSQTSVKSNDDSSSGQDGVTVVAIKTLKENASEEDKVDLLQELEVMKTLGPHPNVVRLLGCCTKKGPLFVIMEFAPQGKLQSFLRDSRAQRYYDNLHGMSSKLTSRDLTHFCHQVARGMEFLCAKGIIHRDLAARNVLVGENQTCKVADFGFARDIMTSLVYERKSEGRLPIRWMAPESLYDNLFSVKSDIWSFGVLVWEIVTLGSTPYPGLAAAEVVKRVKEGYRLEKPNHCRRELYNIMYYCWHQDLNKRPTFAELVTLLEQLLLTDTEYIQLDRFPDHSYYNMDALYEEKL